MGLINRIAKKLRRRFREKGTNRLNVSHTTTAAERLVMSNWGLSFNNPEPERAGVKRQMERDNAKLKANKKIPSGDRMTRQRMRQMARLHEKKIRRELINRICHS